MGEAWVFIGVVFSGVCFCVHGCSSGMLDHALLGKNSSFLGLRTYNIMVGVLSILVGVFFAIH